MRVPGFTSAEGRTAKSYDAAKDAPGVLAWAAALISRCGGCSNLLPLNWTGDWTDRTRIITRFTPRQNWQQLERIAH